MNDRAAQFHLWHPRYDVTSSRVTCDVDVAPADTGLIDRGHPDLVAHFADRLGLGGAEITGWSLTGFNTPYYSYDIDSDDLESSLSPAWRLHIEVSGWSGDPSRLGMQPAPIPAWGDDPTWWEHRRPWDWNAHDTVVIGLNGPDPEVDFLDETGVPVRVETVLLPGPRFAAGQLRISLGRLSLPDEAGTVFDVVLACDRRALVVHCEDSHALF